MIVAVRHAFGTSTYWGAIVRTEGLQHHWLREHADRRDRKTPATMFVAGDDGDAKRIAMDLATEIGFVAEDAGPLGNAKALEELVKVWLALSGTHGRRVAYSISRA